MKREGDRTPKPKPERYLTISSTVDGTGWTVTGSPNVDRIPWTVTDKAEVLVSALRAPERRRLKAERDRNAVALDPDCTTTPTAKVLAYLRARAGKPESAVRFVRIADKHLCVSYRDLITGAVDDLGHKSRGTAFPPWIGRPHA